MKWISLIIFTLFLAPLVEAREWFESFNNTRTTAMGGVKIAVTSDETSLFRNPAGLGSFRGVYANVFDPEVEFSQNQESQFATAGTDVEKVKDFLLANRGKFYHGKMQLTPTIALRHFSIGLMYKNEISAVMNDADTEMDTLYQSDLGAFIALNYSLWEGRIKVGGTGKMVNRIEVDNATLDPTSSLAMTTIANEGTGTGLDAGLSLQAPIMFLPTLSAVARDIGDMKYDTSPGLRLSTLNRPAVVKQSVDAGFSITPIFSKDLRGIFALEYRDTADSRKEEFQAKRMHIGTELIWRDVLYVRLGSNQSYWTAGFEISSERMSWQISTYGEEVGVATAPREDRRYSTRISVRF